MQITKETVLKDIEQRLTEGAASRKSALHTPVVGTADGDMRVMVLREFVPDARTLRFHTDSRSPKVAAIAADPLVHVLAYDPEARVQIRMRGMGKVETAGPTADAAWAEATTFAKRCYLAEAAPSSVSAEPVSGLPDWAEGITPTEDQVLPARDNFAVLIVTVKEFDWLHLANEGHRRAKVSVAADGSEQMEWLVP